MDAAFLELMQQSVTVQRGTGEDAWGNNTYDAGTALACYVDESSQSRPGGSDATDDTLPERPQRTITVYSDVTTPPVMVGDRVVFDGVTYDVTRSQVFYDEDGAHHQQITAETSAEA